MTEVFLLPELHAIICTTLRNDGVKQRAKLRLVCKAWYAMDPDIRWFLHHPDLPSLPPVAREAFDRLVALLDLASEKNMDLPVPHLVGYHSDFVVLQWTTGIAGEYRFSTGRVNMVVVRGPVFANEMGQCKAFEWDERVNLTTGVLKIVNGRKIMTFW